jgi:hypothetical protein
VFGYAKDTKLNGILQSQTPYFSRTANGVTIYPVATQTVYRNTDGTGAETTSYSYTWFTSTLQMQSMTVTKPVISTAQNGTVSCQMSTPLSEEQMRLLGRSIRAAKCRA